jgi:hypothetical protein
VQDFRLAVFRFHPIAHVFEPVLCKEREIKDTRQRM